MKTCERCRLGDCACLREPKPPAVGRSPKAPKSVRGIPRTEQDQSLTPNETRAEGSDRSRDLIKAMAEAVGKDLAAYVEVMYPEAMEAASSPFKTSLKNHVYNDIMHVSTLHTEAEIRAWLESSEAFRKEWLGMYRKMRRKNGK